jgi:hypothetical protein
MVIQQIPALFTLTHQFKWRVSAATFAERLINEYTDHESFADRSEHEADIYHCHHGLPDWILADKDKMSRTLMYMHSVPSMSEWLLSFVPRFTRDRYFVPPQQHALYFPEFAGMNMLRNPVMADDKSLQPAPIPTDKIRVCLPCTNTKYTNTLWYKGLQEAKQACINLAAKYPGEIEFDDFVAIPRDEYLERMRACNIIIDGIGNPSYSRISLEGAAQGRVSITYAAPEMLDLLQDVARSNTHPFVIAGVSDVEAVLEGMIQAGPESLIEQAEFGATWIRKYWNPRDIAQEYISAYRYIQSLEPVA